VGAKLIAEPVGVRRLIEPAKFRASSDRLGGGTTKGTKYRHFRSPATWESRGEYSAQSKLLCKQEVAGSSPVVSTVCP